MRTLIILAVFVTLGVVLLVLTEWRERKRNTRPLGQEEVPTEPRKVREPVDDECCGTHAVCERELLLQKTTEIEYYDDEELDALSGLQPSEYTAAQVAELEEVFFSLKEKDVAGWLRSLQSRNIQLTDELKEQALLIVSERRKA